MRPTHIWEAAVFGEVCVTVSVNLSEDITCFKTCGKSALDVTGQSVSSFEWPFVQSLNIEKQGWKM